jgi:outer membrane lipoprotein
LRHLLPYLALCLVLWGCHGVISRDVEEEASPLKSLKQLREQFDGYVGKTVILGGEVIETRNSPDGTVVLVLEKALGLGQKPKTDDVSGGRFMVRFADYLDPVVFAPGRRVTVAGKVDRLETEPVGEAPYVYVVIEGSEIHIWKDPVYPFYAPWNIYEPWYPWWYDPRWGRRPWWW